MKKKEEEKKGRLLLVDDEKKLLMLVERILKRRGYECLLAYDGEQAWDSLEKAMNASEDGESDEAPIDGVLTDLRMPAMDGMNLLKKIKEQFPQMPIVVLTGHGSIPNAVEAMKLGAADYLIKPVNPEEILLKIESALEVSNLRRENEQLKQNLKRYEPNREIVGDSPVMRGVMSVVHSVARNRSTVLISGESGTGKELIARGVHESSQWARYPFMAVNCGALSETLLESQLFGHKRGAFTGAVNDHVGFFQAAEGGTLFLDEISEMSPQLQVKLLRAIQEKEIIPVGDTRSIKVNVRLVCATNRDLEYEVREGSFRQDLFYRLSVVNIHLPPLRERTEDIPLLISHFILTFAQEYGVAPKSVQPDAMETLVEYPWPGNIRELQNVIERSFALSTKNTIGIEDLPPQLLRTPEEALAAVQPVRQMPTAQSLSYEDKKTPYPGEKQPAKTPAKSTAVSSAKPSGNGKKSAEAETRRFTEPFVPEAPSFQTLEEMEKNQIVEALRKAKGKKTEAARLLGIDRKRLYRKMKKYELMD